MNSTNLSFSETWETAKNTLLAFLYPKSEEGMTPEQRTEFELAVGEQASFLASPEGQTASSAVTGRIAGESIGDVSVTYRNQSGTSVAAGMPVAPSAEARLLRCGLLGRWV